MADLNQLLEQRDVMVEQARATAGDLAHGLKTPLAVITQEAERARRDGQTELAGALFEQVGRMRRQVDAHLARSRVDLSKHRVVTPISAADAVAGVVRTLSQLYAERGLTFAVDADPALNVLVAREDLDELVGNLLDNACKWARTRCSVTVRQAGGRVAVIVEDDGPGISAEMRSQVLTRGVRADEAVPGTGLGLAIVRDLTEAYGGKVVLDESPLGGLRVAIDLPSEGSGLRVPRFRGWVPGSAPLKGRPTAVGRGFSPGSHLGTLNLGTLNPEPVRESPAGTRNRRSSNRTREGRSVRRARRRLRCRARCCRACRASANTSRCRADG